MRLNYKQLGAYIKQLDVRNTDNAVSYLRGVSSVYKCLIQSKANTIGTDMSTYKIVSKNQFVFNPNTARMGDKIPVALNNGDDCIVSQIYPVFKIVDHNLLDPEYLMMWFKRPEFDRYARFKSHGSAREIFDWEQMCEVQLPVPHIDKQREIVKEYNVLANRINLNNQLIQKLEETAQAIYKQWFVDFEFPDENGKPYKSNGGEMVFNEELEKDIPKGWEVKKLNSVFNFNQGSEPGSNSYCSQKISNEYVHFYRVQDIFKYNYFPELFVNKNLLKGGLFNSEDILVSLDGTIGRVFMGGEGGYSSGIRKVSSDKEYVSNSLIFCFLKSNYFKESLNLLSGSETTIKHAGKAIKDMYLIFDKNICIKFSKVVEPIYHQILLKGRQDNLLEKSRELLLSKLATINN